MREADTLSLLHNDSQGRPQGRPCCLNGCTREPVRTRLTHRVHDYRSKFGRVSRCDDQRRVQWRNVLPEPRDSAKVYRPLKSRWSPQRYDPTDSANNFSMRFLVRTVRRPAILVLNPGHRLKVFSRCKGINHETHEPKWRQHPSRCSGKSVERRFQFFSNVIQPLAGPLGSSCRLVRVFRGLKVPAQLRPFPDAAPPGKGRVRPRMRR